MLALHKNVTKNHLISLALLLVVVALLSLNLFTGRYPVTPEEFINTLADPSDSSVSFLLLESKLPELLLALGTGACFAIAGTIFQTIFKNPLASPDILGISSSAAASAVFGMVVLGISGIPLVLCTLLGALIFTGISLLTLFRNSNSLNQARFVLIGVSMATFFAACIVFMMQKLPSSQTSQIISWTVGSLNSSSWEKNGVLFIGALLPLCFCFINYKRLIVLQPGEDIASNLGINAKITTIIFILMGVLLAALTTSTTGPIAFASFLSANIAKILTGHKTSLVVSALVGMILLLLTDYLTVNVFPGNLPAGVVTGLMGAPFLLWFIVKSHSSLSY